jgi:hypothetical protein
MLFKSLFSSRSSGSKEKKARKHGIGDGKWKEAAAAAAWGKVVKTMFYF